MYCKPTLIRYCGSQKKKKKDKNTNDCRRENQEIDPCIRGQFIFD